jgi:hypothetical protein
MGTTRDIAEFACKTTIDDFDSGLVKHIKNVLLSGVGMTMAGVNTPAGEAVLRGRGAHTPLPLFMPL